jgi:osmotically-inducible protein OsmY
MKGRTLKLVAALAGVLFVAPLFLSAASIDPKGPATLEAKVRHELLMLPYYNVFDNLEFTVQGSKVTLLGEVTWPTVKSDAGNVVKAIPGVTSVDNEIKVLPLSPFDNQIRFAEWRAIYSQPSLQRYGMGAIPSIHIIVDNGNVTLVGEVNNQMDRQLAGIRANQVPGVFSVTNNLRVVHS